MKRTSYQAAVWVVTAAVSAYAQPARPVPTPLAALLVEAQANNAQLSASEHAARAAAHIAPQSTSLPDTQFTVQSFSVGSPKPLAGFSNSDFAYLGFGASQDLPYAGKLRLRGELANREAERQTAQTELLRTSIADQVKSAYLRLAYLDASATLLDRIDAVLKPMIDTALSRYRIGQGSQAEILKAQIEHTRLLREVTRNHQETGELEAALKLLLHRPQSSPDILAEASSLSQLRTSAEELQSLVMAQSPAVLVESAGVRRQDAQLASARREGKPDFNVGYMFQQTGTKYRDYYMLTVNLRLPRHKRIQAGIAEAAESLERSRQDLDAAVQQQLAEVQKQYVAATSTAELLAEYNDGLLPQARAAFQAEQTSYQSGRQAFAPVLSSLLDVLTFEHDSQQALLDHETALAHLETLTGAHLR